MLISDDFTSAPDQPGDLPQGWEVVVPHESLAPIFALSYTPDGHRALMAAGNGRRECFGWVRHHVRLEGGCTYCLRVRLQTKGLDDLNRHLVHGVFGRPPEAFNDGIFSYQIQGSSVLGERCFPGPEEALNGEVRLYFRYSPHGRVWWESVSLQPCAPIPSRRARIACSWEGNCLDGWSRWLDRAGEMGADLALLPEMLNGKEPADPEPQDGPTGSLLSAKARQWGMYVCGSFYRQYHGLVLNTALLFDRAGQLIGSYDKNQLHDPEADKGVTPGRGYPVFQTDLATIGIMTCYDNWFPETARLLAYKGAELLLFPSAAYFAGIMPARAADNGVWIAASSLDCPAGLWDPSGARAGEESSDPTRHALTSILACEWDEQERIMVATVDLSRRYSPHWLGGPMLSAPGGRRVRQTSIEPIEPAISQEARRWW